MTKVSMMAGFMIRHPKPPLDGKIHGYEDMPMRSPVKCVLMCFIPEDIPCFNVLMCVFLLKKTIERSL